MQKTTKIIFSLLFLATLASLLAISAASADDSVGSLGDTTASAPAPQPLAVSAFCNVTILKGETWYFFAMSTGGVGNVAFQWYQGTTMLSGQNTMLFAASPTAAGTYTYTCQATDDSGTTVTSNTVTLTVI